MSLVNGSSLSLIRYSRCRLACRTRFSHFHHPACSSVAPYGVTVCSSAAPVFGFVCLFVRCCFCVYFWGGAWVGVFGCWVVCLLLLIVFIFGVGACGQICPPSLTAKLLPRCACAARLRRADYYYFYLFFKRESYFLGVLFGSLFQSRCSAMRSGAIPLSFSKVKWRERGMSLLGSGGGVVQGRSRLKAECSVVRGKGRNGEISGRGGGGRGGGEAKRKFLGGEGTGKAVWKGRKREMF